MPVKGIYAHLGLESEGKGCDKLGTCCNFNSDPVVSFHSESHRDTHLGEEIPSQ